MGNWQEDIKNDDLPADCDAYNKGPGELKSGQRIGWWYKDDVEFAAEFGGGEELEKYPPYSGIVVPVEDAENHGCGYYVENLLVVMDRYPAEKCYCQATWIAYRSLIDNEEFVRVVCA